MSSAVTDPRCEALVALDEHAIHAMLAPVTGAEAIRRIEPVEGGLVNTVYRVTLGAGRILALRVSARGAHALDRERSALRLARAALPVPDVLFADAGSRGRGHPYMVYRWIEGVSLNDFRRASPAAQFLLAAEPLGRALGRLARLALPARARPPLRRLADELERAGAALRKGRARVRLGDAAADALHAALVDATPALTAFDRQRSLAHGDFGGRNVLVRRSGSGVDIAGVVDWEMACVACALWDVGSLFRYGHRYDHAFRTAFARGYVEAGGELPADWWRLSRLMDATRLVGIVDEERELPATFHEVGGLVRDLLSDATAPER